MLTADRNRSTGPVHSTSGTEAVCGKRWSTVVPSPRLLIHIRPWSATTSLIAAQHSKALKRHRLSSPKQREIDMSWRTRFANALELSFTFAVALALTLPAVAVAATEANPLCPENTALFNPGA